MKRTLFAALVVALVATACASSDSGGDDPVAAEPLPPEDSATRPSSTEPVPVEPGEGIGDGSGGSDLPVVSGELAGEVERAVADLAARLGDARLVEVIVAHELTWPNGALGCPEPGTMYTQALVPGYRIELRSDDELFTYHGALGEPPFLCESPLDG